MLLFAIRLEYKTNKFMNQLIHDFMYDNTSKYSWNIVYMFDCLLAANDFDKD